MSADDLAAATVASSPPSGGDGLDAAPAGCFSLAAATGAVGDLCAAAEPNGGGADDAAAAAAAALFLARGPDTPGGSTAGLFFAGTDTGLAAGRFFIGSGAVVVSVAAGVRSASFAAAG